MAQPRDPRTGRFLCVPAYPRLRTSACGCGGGGQHPCPIARKLRPVREAAKRAYRPPRYTTRDLEEVERDLEGVYAEREALRSALDHVRTRIAALGNRHHRSTERGQRAEHGRIGGKSYSDEAGSERGYRNLLAERSHLMAHESHLRSEESQLAKLRRAIIRATERGGRMAREDRVALGYARRRATPLHVHGR